MALAVVLAQAKGWALGAALAGIAAFGLHMARQMRRLDIDDAASCRDVFLSNRDAGLLVALFLAVAAAL